MINLNSTKYLHPTKHFRQLSVMLALHNDPDLRQQDIADQVNMSGAMVNSYIKQMKDGGSIAIESKNRRDLKYRLTKNGHEELMSHLMACSSEIVELYRAAKFAIAQQLAKCFENDKFLRVLLYGGSETARLVMSVLENFPNVDIVGVVDNDANKWGSAINSYVIARPEMEMKKSVDCIVISSFSRQNEIFEAIRDLGTTGIRIVRLSLL